MCEEYAIDGMICLASRTCRAFGHTQLELIDGVSKELSIPAVVIDADHTDITYYSDAQVDTRLQALIETIEARKQTR